MLIDITTFGLADGVEEGTFLAADERVRTGVLYRHAGLVRSTTARGDDGSWVVVTLWWEEGAGSVALTDTEVGPLIAEVDRRQYRTFD